MATLLDLVKKGATNRSVTVAILNADGTPNNTVVFNTAGIDLWYRREGAAKTSITEAALATPALTDPHLDGGFLLIGDGEYRLDVPDAAFATGANHVDIGGTVTGLVVIGGRVRLVDYDPEDAVHLGLSSLPNAVANANGGLMLRATGVGTAPAEIAFASNVGAVTSNTGLDQGDVAVGSAIAITGQQVWKTVVEGATWTAEMLLRGLASLGFGLLSGAQTNTEVTRDQDDTKNRLTYTVDAKGNRTAVVKDLT